MFDLKGSSRARYVQVNVNNDYPSSSLNSLPDKDSMLSSSSVGGVNVNKNNTNMIHKNGIGSSGSASGLSSNVTGGPGLFESIDEALVRVLYALLYVLPIIRFLLHASY